MVPWLVGGPLPPNAKNCTCDDASEPGYNSSPVGAVAAIAAIAPLGQPKPKPMARYALSHSLHEAWSRVDPVGGSTFRKRTFAMREAWLASS